MQHFAVTQAAAAGLRAFPQTTGSFAAAQAAWRFFNNPKTTLPTLVDPLLAFAREAVAHECDRFVLAVQDWSDIGYASHQSKGDRIAVTHDKDLGYDLHACLLVSDRAGSPLAPAYLGLRAADGVHSTRRLEPLPARPHLSEAGRVMRYVTGLRLSRPLVHIIDQEGDSVLHLRRWGRCGLTVLVRGDQIRRVMWQGRDLLVTQVLEALEPEFRPVGEVDVRGKRALQKVAETRVIFHRPAKVKRRGRDGKPYRQLIAGTPLEMRLVVSRIEQEGRLIAQWLLWSNVGEEVGAEQVATWYYWRWRIESCFKLMKSAGHHLEQWQQENAESIARRLLIAAHAAAMVWQLARSREPDAEPVRRMLVRLSGRLMKRGKTYTEPALLAGLFVLLGILDALEHYTVEELKRLAAVALPMRRPPPEG